MKSKAVRNIGFWASNGLNAFIWNRPIHEELQLIMLREDLKLADPPSQTEVLIVHLDWHLITCY